MSKSKKRRRRAAQRILFALAIYSAYRLDSRGPSGCLLEALDFLAPKIAKKIRKGRDPLKYLKD